MRMTLLAAVLAAIGLWIATLYNRLVRLRNRADNAFSTVDVQLKQRCDLIPAVVAAVKGYMAHERSVLQRLIELRARTVDASLSQWERIEVDRAITPLLRQVMARVEDYPELQASQQVEQLQRTLNEVEAQIAAARRTYNAAVTDLNVSMESFPTNLVAGSLGFERKPLFEAEAGEKAVPAVAATAGR